MSRSSDSPATSRTGARVRDASPHLEVSSPSGAHADVAADGPPLPLWPQRAVIDALNRLHCGVIITTTTGAPVLANAYAARILAACDGLTTGRDGLQAV